MSAIPAFEIGVWNAWLFMSVFILQMLAVFLLGRRMWERSSHPLDIQKSRLEGKAGIMGNAVWLLATIYSIFLPLKLGTAWFYTGLIIFLCGLLILTIATFNLATAPADGPAIKGAYRFSRHPLYLSLIIVYIGTSIATASWLFFLLGIANILWVRLEAVVEERYCLKVFGNTYREYMDKTPRWLGIQKS